MGRALGSNAKARTAFETVAGTPPAAGAAWFTAPFSSHSLGEETPLIPDDTLGNGRETDDPTQDRATNTGDIVVPVDARNFGRWLQLFFGPAATTGADPAFTHVFTSGVDSLPSMSIEIGSPEVPAFSTHYLARGNQLKISMAPTGLLSATCSLICKGETAIATVSAAGNNPSALATQRFAQRTGYVNRAGQALGSVVSNEFTYSNNLDTVDTIEADGRIEDADPGMAQMTGTTTLKFKDTYMLDAATDGTPIDLTFGWTAASSSLLFTVPRVFLPRPKKPITGPKGIQIAFNWLSSGKLGPCCTATLINDVATYA